MFVWSSRRRSCVGQRVRFYFYFYFLLFLPCSITAGSQSLLRFLCFLLERTTARFRSNGNDKFIARVCVFAHLADRSKIVFSLREQLDLTSEKKRYKYQNITKLAINSELDKTYLFQINFLQSFKKIVLKFLFIN